MDKIDFLKILVEDIHSTVVATVDDNNLPVTCVIDMMDYDENGIYFLTAKGKQFYKRLINRKYLSLTGKIGKDTMSSKSISFQGYVKEIGPTYLERLFTKNKYMEEIYPNVESRKALSVFLIYKGTGEYFDLSCKPIRRESFTLGNISLEDKGYAITSNCVGCRKCLKVCPQNCIDDKNIPFVILNKNCLCCGNCYDICPNKAIIKY